MMNIKKNDTVKVLAGKDRGKDGKVLEVNPKEQKLIVEGINIAVRFSRPKKQGQKGQRMELPVPLPIGKVILICPHCGKPTRVSHEVNENGNFRKCKKCGQLIQ
jgi:large subunit ribosomal protein L24